MKSKKQAIKLNKLKGKIREEGLTLRTLAPALNMAPNTLCQKINGKAEFSGSEIAKLCNELHISPTEIAEYFFPTMLRSETRKKAI